MHISHFSLWNWRPLSSPFYLILSQVRICYLSLMIWTPINWCRIKRIIWKWNGNKLFSLLIPFFLLSSWFHISRVLFIFFLSLPTPRITRLLIFYTIHLYFRHVAKSSIAFCNRSLSASTNIGIFAYHHPIVLPCNRLSHTSTNTGRSGLSLGIYHSKLC